MWGGTLTVAGSLLVAHAAPEAHGGEAARGAQSAEEKQDEGAKREPGTTQEAGGVEGGGDAELPEAVSDERTSTPAPDSDPNEPAEDLGAGVIVGPVDLPTVQPVTGTDVKLDGLLLQLLRAQRGGGEAAVRAFVEEHRPGLSVERLQIQIICESDDAVAAVREQVGDAGGTVTAGFENYLWAEVALGHIETLVAAEAVWSIAVSQTVARPFGR